MQTIVDNDNFLIKASKHILVIEYTFGTAGNLVNRIIGSDSNYYWNKDINNSYEDSIDPLYWPLKGFIPQHRHRLTAEEQKATCHTGYCILSSDSNDLLMNCKLLYLAINNKSKLIIKTTDPVRYLSNSIPIVRVVGDSLIRKIYNKDPLEIEEHTHTFNLNINKLTSVDYNTFLKEYLRLCKFLHIKPNIDKVRAFINIWLDKQK